MVIDEYILGGRDKSIRVLLKVERPPLQPVLQNVPTDTPGDVGGRLEVVVHLEPIVVGAGGIL
jgi:hypothetical protein